MTDAPRQRRRLSRAWLLVPLVLAAIALAAWVGYWFVARDRLLAGLDAQAAAHRQQGRTVEWRARRVEGFPYRFKLVFDDLRLASPSGWAVETPRFEAQANAYQLTRWVGAAPQGLTLVRPVAGPIRIEGRVLRASVAGVDRSPPRISLEGADVRFVTVAGAEPFLLTGAERVELHLRPTPDAADMASLLLRLRGAQPRPAGVMAFISGAKPANFVWDSRVTQLGELRGADWSAAMRRWTRAGGRMNVREATLQAGELRARNAGGYLTAGLDGRLRGRVVVALNQPLQALSALTRIEQTDPTALGTATAITEARKEPNVELALGFEAGVTTIGPVAIAPAPKVF
jgi:hypothetical protein